MDIYHLWCNLKPGVSDIEFSEALAAYLSKLKQDGSLENYRISRRKLGLSPAFLGEFHIMMEFLNLAQLDDAFTSVSTRSEPLEGLHAAVNSRVTDVHSALYREFPDQHRQRGNEKF